LNIDLSPSQAKKQKIIMAPNPPTVADLVATSCLIDFDGRNGVAHDNLYGRAGKASKRRKIAEELHSRNNITMEELGMHEVYLAQEVLSGIPPEGNIPGLPAWFAPAMAAAMGPINETLNDMKTEMNDMKTEMNDMKTEMNTRLNDMNTRLNDMNTRLINIEGTQAETNTRLNNINSSLFNIQARQNNLAVHQADDHLQPLQNADGNIPDHFPATYHALQSVTNAQRSVFLKFYGLPTNPAAAREHNLRKFLGIRP